MNRFFTLLLAASCLTVGQVTYPYNPDEDGNGLIGVPDLQGLLALYGGAFDYELWRSHIHATLNSCASGARVMKGSTPESAER